MAVQIVFEIIIVLLAACGLVMHSGWARGEVRKDFFRYYTNLSNLLVAMFYLMRLVVRIRGSYDGFFGRIVFSELWFYSVTMTIFLTFGIFHFVLVPGLKKIESAGEEFKWLHGFPNYCVHYIIPLLSLLNWLIFSVKSELSYAWALIWTVIPWIYVVYAMIMGHSGKIIENTDSAYPYDFMDVGRHGWKIVVRNCALVMVVFVAAGLLLIFLRKLI